MSFSFQWPVGLKNVGATCWFSSVIQSLFYLTAFRDLVLNFQPFSLKRKCPSKEDGKLESLSNKDLSDEEERMQKIFEFMVELRRLFALMLASERKYVDPSKAVEILRSFMSSSSSPQAAADNQQEDVSEFTHIIFEMMERAFKSAREGRTESREAKEEEEKMMEESSNNNNNNNYASTGGNNDSNKVEKEEKLSRDPETMAEDSNHNENPISLFYLKTQSEGVVRGEKFIRDEMFTQYTLQVANFSEIHESLESSTANERMGTEASMEMERWFTDLPPVLIFSLSRFEYNVKRQVAEKIHNRFDFPEVLFMDRYMIDNKEVTRAKREEVKLLKARREVLSDQLQKYTDYGTGPQKMALPTILQYTLDFANSESNTKSLNAVPSTASLMQVDETPTTKGPTSSQANLCMTSCNVDDGPREPADVEMTEVDAQIEDADADNNCDKSQQAENALVSCDEESESQVSGPSPRHVTESELRALQVGPSTHFD